MEYNITTKPQNSMKDSGKYATGKGDPDVAGGRNSGWMAQNGGRNSTTGRGDVGGVLSINDTQRRIKEIVAIALDY